MAYKKEELIALALQAITENKLFFVEDIVSFLPCSKPTYYKHKLNEVDSIKEELEKNKTETKVILRDKWLSGDNATLQMGLYKLIANDNERKKLAMEYREHSGGDKPLNINIRYVDPKDGK